MALDVIILAAGRSSRSTIPKPLRPFDAKPWIVELVRSWRSLGADRVLVCWNPAFPVPTGLDRAPVRVVRNPDTDMGPMRSVQLAVSALGDPGPVTAITPVDCPPPTQGMLAMLGEHLAGHPAVHPEYRGKGGHPVLASPECLRASLREDPATARLDDFLKRQGALRFPVDDPTVALNLNDDESWQAWLVSHLKEPSA